MASKSVPLVIPKSNHTVCVLVKTLLMLQSTYSNTYAKISKVTCNIFVCLPDRQSLTTGINLSPNYVRSLHSFSK